MGSLALMGQPAEALEHIRRAIELSPEDDRIARWLYFTALAHFAEEEYETATDWAERALSHSQSNYITADAHLILASSHAHLGHADRAAEALGEALRLWSKLTADLVPLPTYTDEDLRERYVDGLREAGLEGVT